MGHTRVRPIVGQTAAGVGATYIVVCSMDELNIQVIANGTVTFTVDWTNQNILYDAASQAGRNVVTGETARYVAPASATWVNLLGSGSANAVAQFDYAVFAVRINITAGTGSVSYHIAQG